MKACFRPVKQLKELLGKAMSCLKRDTGRDNELMKQECESCDKLLDWNGAVQLFSFSKNYLIALVCRREIQHYRRGRRIYFHRSELLRWEKRWKDGLFGKEPFKGNQI